jgi:preprotein translocase subunit SecA
MREYYSNINVSKEKRLYKGVDTYTNMIIGVFKNRLIDTKSLKQIASDIHKLSLSYQQMGEEELDSMIKDAKKDLRLNKADDSRLCEIFALAVELCYRVTQKRAYIVQIMGAFSLYKKYIIQMATGEGKTLTASIGAVVLGWRGKPLHILSSNDYLSARDAELFRILYERAGLSVGSVTSSTKPNERKELYKKDIVYSTAKEILADFLKDRMQEPQKFDINTFFIDKITNNDTNKNYLIRGLDTVIVDEADSVLADDAVTPLIISAKAENRLLKEAVLDAHNLIKNLEKDAHYELDEKFYDVSFTKLGLEVIDAHIEALSDIWKAKSRREFLIKQAIVARDIYTLNKEYIIKDGAVIIIDEKTGRVMEGRSWGNGLHQAIEVKESLEITDPTITHSKMSFQRFFRLYNHLCGMSGTLSSLSNELWQIYEKKIVKIPTRLQSKMDILEDKIYLTQKDKEKALIEYIKDKNSKGLPILIGVTSIKESETLSQLLKKENIECTLLNALYNEEEATIIAQAGQMYKVTIATNMAGRGTDIHISDEVESMGGLQVILTQKDKSKRVDLQFFGRCARQGQKGCAVAFLSLEDKILQNYLNKKLLDLVYKNFDNKYTKKFTLLAYKYYQYRIEKTISNIRKKVLQNEFTLDDNMSYISNSY